MFKKISYLLVGLVIATTFLFATGSAFAEEDPDTLVLKDGDTGDNVILVQLRLRDLGYFNYKITNYYGKYTSQTVADFQKVNNITADGVIGPSTFELLFSNDAKRKPVKKRVKPKPTVKKGSSSSRTGKLRDWFGYVKSRFDRGEKVKVYDVDTGISYYMVRVGGRNHADVEPATKYDTAQFKKTYDGEWSWDRRAVVVRLDGEYIAASTNGFPHGYETVSGNGMTGQVCIHFLNSKTHIHDAKDPAHQAMVKKAAGK